MKRYLKLAGFVFIGWISTLALWLLASLAPVASTHDLQWARAAGFYALWTFMLSLLLGGGITGYLCSQDIKTKRGFVWITPGLYFVLLEAAIFILCADKMMPGMPEMMLLAAVALFFVSWAGVGVGHYIRCEMLRPRT
jgi:hypothetical protein